MTLRPLGEGEGQIRWCLHLGRIFERFAAISTAFFRACFTMRPFSWTYWNSPSMNSFALFLHTPMEFTAMAQFCLFYTLTLGTSTSGITCIRSLTSVERNKHRPAVKGHPLIDMRTPPNWYTDTPQLIYGHPLLNWFSPFPIKLEHYVRLTCLYLHRENQIIKM